MVDRTKAGWFLRELMEKNPPKTRESRELNQLLKERECIVAPSGPEFQFDDL